MLDLFYLFGNSVLEKLPALHVTLELELKGEKRMRRLEMLLRQLHGNFCISRERERKLWSLLLCTKLVAFCIPEDTAVANAEICT